MIEPKKSKEILVLITSLVFNKSPLEIYTTYFNLFTGGGLNITDVETKQDAYIQGYNDGLREARKEKTAEKLKSKVTQDD